jgi:hypothetical protein
MEAVVRACKILARIQQTKASGRLNVGGVINVNAEDMVWKDVLSCYI